MSSPKKPALIKSLRFALIFKLFACVISGLLALPATIHAAEGPQSTSMSAACPKLLNETFPRLQDEQPQSLCQYAGKVILVVNTASYCGFTRQYDGLEQIYKRYKDQGLVILGFPSNDFGQQEPESNKKIADFCRNTYSIKFPMFTKSSVRGPNANLLFRALTKQTGEAPSWNFHKYLISRDGKSVQSFGSQITPLSLTMTNAIEEQLRERQ
jgi:glutathione peroxidase